MNILQKLNIHPSWADIIEPWVTFKEGNLKQVFSELKGLEMRNKTVCPVDKYNLFRAFSIPKDKVRIVWMLQDPYPNPRLANGVALSVPKGEMSPSLEAVKDELFEYILDFTIDEIFDETLELWTNQGILMLNSALSCLAYQPKSHTEMWEPFIKHVIKELNKESGRIFIFSGKVAQNFSKYVTDNNYVIKTYHPAADKHQVKKENKLFVGNGLFKQVDDILESINGSEFKIKWLRND